MQITKLSSKGQIILPKSVRTAHHWRPGTRFIVQDVEGGVLLRPAKPFRPVDIDELIGCVGYQGRRKSLKEMDAAIAKGARESREDR